MRDGYRRIARITLSSKRAKALCIVLTFVCPVLAIFLPSFSGGLPRGAIAIVAGSCFTALPGTWLVMFLRLCIAFSDDSSFSSLSAADKGAVAGTLWGTAAFIVFFGMLAIFGGGL
jgi:hypothetical protein